MRYKAFTYIVDGNEYDIKELQKITNRSLTGLRKKLASGINHMDQLMRNYQYVKNNFDFKNDPYDKIQICLTCTKPKEFCNGTCIQRKKKNKVTERDLQILNLLRENYDNREIAKMLNIKIYLIVQTITKFGVNRKGRRKEHGFFKQDFDNIFEDQEVVQVEE